MTENERVRMLRKHEDLTLEEFGKRLGVGKTAISKIESGDRNLTDQMCRSICREFHVSETWLRTGEGTMREDAPADKLDAILQEHGLPGFLRGLFLRYANLSPAAQREVEEQIKAWALEIAEQTTPALVRQSEPTAKPWNEMTREEKIAEFTRQLDEEEATHGEEQEHGGLAAG